MQVKFVHVQWSWCIEPRPVSHQFPFSSQVLHVQGWTRPLWLCSLSTLTCPACSSCCSLSWSPVLYETYSCLPMCHCRPARPTQAPAATSQPHNRQTRPPLPTQGPLWSESVPSSSHVSMYFVLQIMRSCVQVQTSSAVSSKLWILSQNCNGPIDHTTCCAPCPHCQCPPPKVWDHMCKCKLF